VVNFHSLLDVAVMDRESNKMDRCVKEAIYISEKKKTRL